ncbi:MAG: hypothetical protein HGGPFJEG_01513 [Ignavibacteria bacterium]|nr:hypothetical protein [Ignavibacteria bacterium]
MNNKEFYIKKISADDTRHLRQIILRPHQTANELVYPGDDDSDSVHFGLYFENKLCGIASVYRQSPAGENSTASWRLRGMATTEETRGMGFGKELMKECLNFVRSKNGEKFWCTARTTAEGFYELFGLKRHGDVFTPEGLGEHVIMSIKL